MSKMSVISRGVSSPSSVTYEADLKRDLKNPKFRKAYEAEKRKLELALQLIRLRKKQRLSQRALAKKVGTSQSAIARLEAGNANVTIDTLSRIAAVLKRSLIVGLR